MKSCIYQIRNTINNKCYIGSAINYNHRWAQHRSKLRSNKHQNSYLQLAWNKYGEINFEFIIIELVPDKVNLLEREQFWINWTRCFDRTVGYNLFKTAGSPLGTKHSQLSKDNMGKSHKGFKHTDETKEKIRKAHKGKKVSEETRAKMSLGQIGNKKTKGLKRPYVTERNKLNVGKKHSVETKIKMSLASKGKLKSEEHKKKLSEAAKKRWKSNGSISKSTDTPQAQTVIH